MKFLKTLFRELLLGLLLAVLLWAIDRSLNFAEYDTGEKMSRRIAWRSWWVRFAALIAFIVIVLVTMSLSGCAYVSTKPTPLEDKHTVLVVNLSDEEYNVYADGHNLGRVHAGYSACMTLPMLDTGFLLVARPVGGGEVRFSPSLDNYRNWTWVIPHLAPEGEDENLNLTYNHC